MKLLLLLTSLIACAQAQFSIGAPKPGSTLVPGQDVTVQVIVPISTSAEAGLDEVGLVIGIVSCGTSGCPSPSADLGENLFIGRYEGQGLIGNTLNSFQNFTFVVPNDVSGTASIQVQHVTLITPPRHSFPGIQYASVGVQVGSGSSGISSLSIHPNGDNSKCVGILGGAFADGTPVDVFDCNGSNTQKWQWNANTLTSVNPADGSHWCLDAGDESTWTNGQKMKIWQCFPSLPQQTWTTVTTSGTIKIISANFCLDLTNGNKTNQNVLQIWQCTANDANQIWSVTAS